MRTAIDTGCLRCMLNNGLCSLFRKCHSRHHPLAIARIASGVNAQVGESFQLQSGKFCSELCCPPPCTAAPAAKLASKDPVQESAWISNSPAALALGPYDGFLGVVAKAPYTRSDGSK